jgi:hypothetical protein
MKPGWCGGLTKVDVGCTGEVGDLVDLCFVFDLEDHLGT